MSVARPARDGLERLSALPRRAGVLVIVAVAVTVAVGCSPSPPQAPSHDETRMNLIILLVDTLRADHLGCYGYERDTSPQLDAFAESGVRFENVTSQAPWTVPSVTTLLTSLYPTTHHLVTYKDGKKVRRLADTVTTLGETLTANGYQTAAVTANPWIGPNTGLDRGFTDFTQLSERHKPHPAAHEVNEHAVRWLSARDSRPFFLFLHYMDVHGPYRPPKAYRTMFRTADGDAHPMTDAQKEKMPKYLRLPAVKSLDGYIDLYDGQIRYWDDQFAQFIERLEARGDLANTMVVVTSDHGEEFFEHGGFNHGATLFQEQVSVPLILKLPGNHAVSLAITSEVELVDVVPTLLALMDIDADPDAQGDDLGPLIRRSPWQPKPAFSEATVAIGGLPHPDGVVKSVRIGELKTIVNLSKGSALTFDLEENPGEVIEIARAANLPTEAGRAAIDQWNERNIAAGSRFSTDWSDNEETTIEQLEALGYVER